MRSFTVFCVGLALMVCFAGLGIARAADTYSGSTDKTSMSTDMMMGNASYDQVYGCWDSCNRCADKCRDDRDRGCGCERHEKCGGCESKCGYRHHEKCESCRSGYDDSYRKSCSRCGSDGEDEHWNVMTAWDDES